MNFRGRYPGRICAPLFLFPFSSLLNGKWPGILQDEAVAEHEQRLQNAVQMVQQLERKQETVIHDKMEQVGDGSANSVLWRTLSLLSAPRRECSS